MSVVDSLDVRALVAAGCAASVTWFLTAKVFRPFAPSITVGKLLDKSVLGLIAQGAAGQFRGKEAMHSHEVWTKENGREKPIGHRVFYLQRMSIANADDAEYVLINAEREFTKGSGYHVLKLLLGSGLVTTFDADVHAHARKVCNPAFSPAAIRRYSDETIRNHGMWMLKTIDKMITEEGTPSGSPDRAELKLRAVMSRTALQVIAEAAFHTEDEKSIDEIAQHSLTAMSNGFSMIRFLPLVNLIPTPGLRRRERAQRQINQFTANKAAALRREIFGEGKDARTMSAAQRESFVADGKGVALLDYLLLDHELSGKPLSDHCLTFLFAGHETTANTLNWFLILIAHHPEVQQRLAEELEGLCGLGVAPTLDDARSCEYLQCVVNEVLRLYPVAPIVGRRALHDDVLPGSKTFIEKDMNLLVNIFSIHRDPSIYGDDAETFVPERWEGAAGQELKAKLKPCQYMPFSVGPRNCIGKDLAMAELLILTAMLVRNFRVSWPEGKPFPQRMHRVTLQPNKQCPVIVEKREV